MINFEDLHPNFRWTQQLPIKLKMFHFIPLSLGPELSLNIVKTSMKFHWHLHWLLAGKQFNFGLALLLLLHSRNVLGLGLQLGQPMAALRTGWDIAPSRPSLLVTFIVSVCSTAHHTNHWDRKCSQSSVTNRNKFQAEPSANSRARQLDNSMVGNITRIRFPVALSLSNLSLSPSARDNEAKLLQPLLHLNIKVCSSSPPYTRLL